MSEQPQVKRSPWVYVGIGCTALVVLGCIGSLAVGFFIKRAGEQYVDEMQDPTRREAKAKKVAAETFGGVPEGYYPVFSFSVPFFMDMLLFSDTPSLPDGGGDLGKRGAMLVRTADPGDGSRVLDFFEGRSDDSTVLASKGINIEVEEPIAKGKLEHKGHTVYYASQRGKFGMQNGPKQRGQEGLSTVLFFECPKDEKQRFGLWFGEDPAPQTPVAQLDLGDTVASPKKIEAFIAPLSPCGK